MKHRILSIGLIFLTACLSSGCDMFRSIAGRPTSEDLAMMKSETAAREAAEAARRDSLETALRLEADSLARESALDSLKRMGGLLREPSRLGGLASSSVLSSRYYAVLGSFKDSANATRYLERIKTAGYTAELITFRTGLTSVGACPENDPVAFLEMLGKIRGESFCPKDFWILVNE